MNTHTLGNIGEARVMFEAVKRGYTVCVPHGHDTRYDLVVDRCGKLERVQVKTTQSDGKCVTVRTRSVGKMDGHVIAKQYTAVEVDWIVVYDITSDRCAFIPADALNDGRYSINLRLQPTASNQEKKVSWFSDYETW